MDNEIYQKLNSIENLNDRILLKKVLNSIFTSIQEHSDEQFQNLEKRVFDEIEYKQKNLNVFCTVVKRTELDPTSEFLYTMLEEDAEEKIYDTKYIMKNINEKKEVGMFSVFLECDYLIFKNIINSKKIFKGTIETDKRIYEGHFILRKNEKYLKKIAGLYKSFIDNNIPWSTINNPYIRKMADVILIDCEEEIKDGENVNRVIVDFGEYSDYVKYDMVPIWNVKRLALKSDGFPLPCNDTINYEHKIQLSKEGIENGYLVDVQEENIKYILRTEDSIRVATTKSEAKLWYVWKLVMPKSYKTEKYDYDLVSNAKVSNFIGRLALKNGLAIKTKAEINRIINSYIVSDYLDFQDIRLEDITLEEKENSETYEMNDFVIDEIRDTDRNKVLMLYFKDKDVSKYLSRDILSFIVSEIQLLYPEYKCEGRLL